MNTKQKGYILVTLAGMFWATTGIFVSGLIKIGLESNQIAFIRLFLGFIILFIYSFIKDKNLLRINKKIFIYCLLLGVISHTGFNLFYFKAIEEVGVSIAAVLLYTSPLFLAIMSIIVYKEKLNKQKIVSLVFCFIGATLAITNGSLDFANISRFGITIGILSAISYASMSIISKKALYECKGITILIYGFLIASITIIPLSKPWQILSYTNNVETLSYILGLGAISAAGGYIVYMEGISKEIDLSIAGVLASGELIGSVIIGWVLLGESFSLMKLFGILLMVLSGIICVDLFHQKLDITNDIENEQKNS